MLYFLGPVFSPCFPEKRVKENVFVIFVIFSQITGDHNLTQLHLDTGLVQCQTYILLNSTFANEHPDIAAFITNLCPNNCSSNGICTSGMKKYK